MIRPFDFEAGIWDPDAPRAVWSRHRTEAAAKKAARSYMLRRWKNGGSTGGRYSWSGWWARVDGPQVWVKHVQDIP